MRKIARAVVFVSASCMLLGYSVARADEVEKGELAIKEYLQAQHGELEFFLRERPDSIPAHRPRAYGKGELREEGEIAVERVLIGFVFPEHVRVFEGVREIKLRAFGPLDEVVDDGAKEIKVVGDTATIKLTDAVIAQINDLAKSRSKNFYVLTLVVKRPLVPAEKEVLAKANGQSVNYLLDLHFERKGSVLEIAVDDPRVHLFHSLALPFPEGAYYYLDRWYGADGTITRQVATYAHPDFFPPPQD